MSEKRFDNDYAQSGLAIGELVSEKQAAYGDSFGKSGKVLRLLYPEGIPPEKMDDALTIVRVVDKLFRIATATARDAFGESPWRDIAGYAILAVVRLAKRKDTDPLEELGELRKIVDRYRNPEARCPWCQQPTSRVAGVAVAHPACHSNQLKLERLDKWAERLKGALVRVKALGPGGGPFGLGHAWNIANEILAEPIVPPLPIHVGGCKQTGMRTEPCQQCDEIERVRRG